MFKILFCSKQYPLTLEYLKKHLPSDKFYIYNCNEEDLKNEIKNADVAVPLMSKLTSDIIKNAKKLKLIHQFGVGLEGVDLNQASKQKIYVANIPANKTGNAYSVSELTLFLILGLLKNYNEARVSFKNKKIGYPLGDVIINKKFLILGYGNVGKAVVDILKKFKVKIIVAKREIKDKSTKKIKFITFNDLNRYLPEIDFLIVAIALNEQTKNFVDEKIIFQMKKDSYLINVSRGATVKYEALLKALKENIIKGAGLDVYWDEPFEPNDELLKYNVFCTPHIAGSTTYSYNLMAKFMARNIKRVLLYNKEPFSWQNINFTFQDKLF